MFIMIFFQLKGLTNDALLAELLIINNRRIITLTTVGHNIAYGIYLVIKDA
ncbi:MAG: hypothetical protein H7334_12310 [Ferruginibacter sp.]|nr:hypothetical protein [Ferruginibacter sp.]